MPNVGDVVAGKFVIERLIGQGGMGAVFAARHRELDSVVAVKVMLADTTNVEATARFKNEGRAAAKIRSQHVVRVEDVGEEKGYAYMILELLEGEDLAQILEKRKRLTPNEVTHYLLEALEGVRLAHEKGIIHRDLKPSNLFLARRDDGTSVVKVLDFGISKTASSLSQAAGNLTSTKAMLGSPLYMSPEQLRSSKSVDVRADIWALGVIMYELLTGSLPFMGESLGELFAAILENDPAPPSSRAPEVPADLDAIVMRCLQRRPEHRFQSVGELTAAVASLAGFNAQTGLGPMGTRMLPAGASGAAFHAAHAGMGSQPHIAVSTGAYGPPPGAPAGPRPSFPGATTTGSGSNIPVVKGTMPFGAATPQPYAQVPGQGFPTMGSTTNPGVPTKSNGFAIAIAAVAVLVIGGAVVGGLALRKGRDTSAAAGSASTAASSSLPVATETVPPIVSVAAPATPSATVAPVVPAASASVAVPVAVEPSAGKKSGGAPVVAAGKPKDSAAAPAKNDPPKPAEAKPTTTPGSKPPETKFENMR